MAKRSPAPKFSTSMQLLITAARRFGVKVEPISIADNLAYFSFKGRKVLVKATVPVVNGMVGSRISVNKFLSKLVLERAGFQVPRGRIVTSWPAAKKAFGSLTPPCVMKPLEGAHGYGLTIGITSQAELKQAYEKVQRINKLRHYKAGAVLEERKVGRDLRFFVIDGRVWAVLERVPASVIGDGRRTISQLIAAFNRMPQVSKAGEFNKPLVGIAVDADVRALLRDQHLTLKSVPAKGQRAWLRKQANISLGGTSHDVTDEVSPGLKKFAAQAVAAINLRIAGIDILVDDIHAPTAKKAGAWILEVNDAPGIDIHHYPYRGKPQPIATGIVAAIFPGLKVPKAILPPQSA